MSLNVSEQTEAQIAEEVRRRGVTVDALLKRLMDEHAASLTAEHRETPELPAWRLGVIGSFTGGTSTTMSLEPGLVDANILVYAAAVNAPRYAC